MIIFKAEDYIKLPKVHRGRNLKVSQIPTPELSVEVLNRTELTIRQSKRKCNVGGSTVRADVISDLRHRNSSQQERSSEDSKKRTIEDKKLTIHLPYFGTYLYQRRDNQAIKQDHIHLSTFKAFRSKRASDNPG